MRNVKFCVSVLTLELLPTCYSTSCSSVIRSNMVSIDKRHPSYIMRFPGGGGGGGGGGPMTTFGDLGNYVNDFTTSPHDF